MTEQTKPTVQPNGTVGLCIFEPFGGTRNTHQTDYSGGGPRPHCWSWPERVP